MIFSAPLFAQSSLVEEAGYIMAMETTFLAMSYLSTQDQYYGHFAVGGFDAFMAYSGFLQAMARYEEVPQYKGMFLIASGFLLKSLYNFQSANIKDKNKLMWINFLAYNLLVFSGYAITENFGNE